jgi:hypothetical protein
LIIVLLYFCDHSFRCSVLCRFPSEAAAQPNLLRSPSPDAAARHPIPIPDCNEISPSRPVPPPRRGSTHPRYIQPNVQLERKEDSVERIGEESSALTWRSWRRVLAVGRWPDETEPLLGARLRCLGSET